MSNHSIAKTLIRGFVANESRLQSYPMCIHEHFFPKNVGQKYVAIVGHLALSNKTRHQVKTSLLLVHTCTGFINGVFQWVVRFLKIIIRL